MTNLFRKAENGSTGNATGRGVVTSKKGFGLLKRGSDYWSRQALGSHEPLGCSCNLPLDRMSCRLYEDLRCRY